MGARHLTASITILRLSSMKIKKSPKSLRNPFRWRVGEVFTCRFEVHNIPFLDRQTSEMSSWRPRRTVIHERRAGKNRDSSFVPPPHLNDKFLANFTVHVYYIWETQSKSDFCTEIYRFLFGAIFTVGQPDTFIKITFELRNISTARIVMSLDFSPTIVNGIGQLKRI